MNYRDSQQLTKIACIGTGLMGSGWAAHFLRSGLRVVAYDPNPDAQTYVRDTVRRSWPVLEALGLSAGADPELLHVTSDLEEALEGADFVQESAPEDEALKMHLLSQLDAMSPPDVAICSSSSGFLAARLRSGCRQGGRVLVGHPFNPPYLIPLVEVVAGEGADPRAVEAAVDIYRACNGRPIVLRKDILGYVANRLQLALFREVFHLLAEDVASVGDIDDAIAYGPGLRWAVMGPCQIFALASQRPEQFADFIDLLVEEIDTGCVAIDSPTIEPGVKQALIDGVAAAARGRSQSQLIEERDSGVIALRKALGL